MPALHSKFKDYDCIAPYGIAILPINPDLGEPEDIIDEALAGFRINIYFHNYEILSEADRTLVFLTVCIQKCLALLKDVGEDEVKAKKVLGAWCNEAIPHISSSSFFMKYITSKSTDSKGDELAKYFKTIRNELVKRLLSILYNAEWGTMDLKYWIGFNKKKFLNFEWK